MYLVGIPVLLAMSISGLYEFLTHVPDPSLPVQDILRQEVSQLKQGVLKKSALRNPILLWWTPFSVSENRVKTCGEDSESVCIISKDRNLLKHPMTKAALFYGSDFNIYDLPLPRSDLDWGLLHEESPKNNYIFSHQSTMELFNHTATFRKESDEPLTLMYLKNLDSLVRDLPMKTFEEKSEIIKKEKLSPILYIQSNCDNPMQRDQFVKTLGKHISIDSYGQCLQNKTAPKSINHLNLIAKYKFVIAIENAECKDYISEKLWNALTAGTVPIYFGASNIRDYLPNPDSAILVDEFDSIEKLAEKIQFLSENPVEYKKLLKHKKRYSNGKPISNQNLSKLLRKRKWKSLEQDQADNQLSVVESFECLICKRISERMKMQNALTRNT